LYQEKRGIMKQAVAISKSGIQTNNYTGRVVEGESFITDHVFSCIISGSQDMYIGNKLYHFKEGDFRLFRKNRLVKYAKKPAREGYRTIMVTIAQTTLREIQKEIEYKDKGQRSEDPVFLLKPNGYLTSYIDSLTPYLNDDSPFKDRIVQLKVKELVLILRETLPALGNVLFDFSEPGKLDLEAFMNEHYRYNVELKQFAYLTGRSLSTFKRDFEKVFHATPNKWLVQRRLQEAQFLIRDKKKRPAEIYLDLGFEDLSHFSFAYKKAFGSAPTQH
jgi:AraC-like DNA-binding protein